MEVLWIISSWIRCDLKTISVKLNSNSFFTRRTRFCLHFSCEKWNLSANSIIWINPFYIFNFVWFFFLIGALAWKVAGGMMEGSTWHQSLAYLNAILKAKMETKRLTALRFLSPPSHPLPMECYVGSLNITLRGFLHLKLLSIRVKNVFLMWIPLNLHEFPEAGKCFWGNKTFHWLSFLSFLVNCNLIRAVENCYAIG